MVGRIIGVTERAAVANDANQLWLLLVSCQDGETAAHGYLHLLFPGCDRSRCSM